MDKLTVRAPAPPLLVSAALVIVLTGNLVVALLTVVLTSFVHAFWARLVDVEEDDHG